MPGDHKKSDKDMPNTDNDINKIKGCLPFDRICFLEFAIWSAFFFWSTRSQSVQNAQCVHCTRRLRLRAQPMANRDVTMADQRHRRLTRQHSLRSMEDPQLFTEEESVEAPSASMNGEQTALAVASSTSDEEELARLHAEHNCSVLQEHE